MTVTRSCEEAIGLLLDDVVTATRRLARLGVAPAALAAAASDRYLKEQVSAIECNVKPPRI